MRRFFVSAKLLHAVDNGAQLILPKQLVHHIKTVLRLSVGTEVVLCDGSGRCCQCCIETLSSNSAVTRVLSQWLAPETALSIELIQALPSSDKLDFVLQKNTELGVTNFQPVITNRSQFAVPENKLERKMERWQRIVAEAARQSERSWLPQVAEPVPVAQAVAQCNAELKLVLWEQASIPFKQQLPVTAPRSVAVLVGPEGGLCSDEVADALAHGFIAVGLGPRILRTETAGLALAAILQFHYGDLALLPVRQPVTEMQ
jgi:16S rRNA (uracil1498-N3)-methyltransferase